MLKKRRPTSGSGSSSRPCECVRSYLQSGRPFDSLGSPAKKQRIVDCAKVLLDIAKESADWFPPLKAVLGGVNALIKHYEVLIESTTVVSNLYGRS